MNNLTVFESKQFGKVRTIVINKEPWFVANDIAKALGYEKARNAITQHVDKDDALKQGVTDNLGRKQETTLINESGLYALIFGSKLETAKQFKHWVTSEVLPSIRKTGSYQAKPMDELRQKNVQIREQNAKIRTAQLLYKIADKTDTDYKQVLHARITHLLTGEYLLPLPEVNEHTYSAEEIATRLGISAWRVGRLANLHGLKIPKYGKYFYDKAKTADKQVETWRYYESVIPVLKSLIEVEVA